MRRDTFSVQCAPALLPEECEGVAEVGWQLVFGSEDVLVGNQPVIALRPSRIPPGDTSRGQDRGDVIKRYLEGR
jgi:hypothetical protein